MRRLFSLIGTLALSLGGGCLTTQATAIEADSSGWIRYHQPDVDVPAGHGCAFAVHEHVVRDREFYKVLTTYDDGTHQAELWRGPLVMRYRNIETGSSVVVNLNGRGRVTYYGDGSFASITILSGHFGATIPPGNETPTGLYRVNGRDSALTLEPDGSRYLVLGRHGSLDDICAQLA